VDHAMLSKQFTSETMAAIGFKVTKQN